MRHVQLRAFHHVAMHRGFSRAAQALHLTQPAVSDQVRKLETEYDVLLFDRRHKPVKLSPAGERLLAITQRLFDAHAQAEEFLSESRARQSGTLRIIADSVLHITTVLPQFRTRYPAINIHVHTGNTEQVQAQLRNYQADVGVLGVVPDEREFAVIRLSATRLVAFAARNHPLAKLRTVAIGTLLDETLVLRESGSKTRQKFEQSVAELGFPVPVPIEAEGREAVREIVATGLGVGIVSAAEFGADERFVAIPITDCDISMDEALVCLRERASVARIRAFLGMADRFPTPIEAAR